MAAIDSLRPRYWLDAALWAVLISVFSAMPASLIPKFIGPLSGSLHIIEFAVLGAFLARAFMNDSPWHAAANAFLLSLVAAAAYACIDELHQRYVPGRVCDPIDAICDIAGAATGAISYIVRKERACRS